MLGLVLVLRLLASYSLPFFEALVREQPIVLLLKLVIIPRPRGPLHLLIPRIPMTT